MTRRKIVMNNGTQTLGRVSNPELILPDEMCRHPFWSAFDLDGALGGPWICEDCGTMIYFKFEDPNGPDLR